MNKQLRILILLVVLFSAIFVFMKKELRLGLDLQGGMRLVLEAQETADIPVDQDIMMGILSVVRRRVDEIGVAQPTIHRKGLRQVVVELPGIEDPDKAIELIGETALLEFIEAEWAPENIFSLTPKEQKLLVGENVRIEKVEFTDAAGNITSTRPIVLKNRVLTGADLKTVNPGTNNGQPIVNIAFTPEGGKIFHAVTARSVGKPLAILLDGKVISAPNINAAIPGGKAFIEGGFSIQEMRDLVIKLKAGSLPVPVEIISNKIVGPTLGQDSIERSKKAGLIGLALVCLYMLFFYRLAGLIATFALVFYLLLTLSVLKLFDATLTLPGIAGIILTVGMAVDANVIIFERIKDELRSDNSLLSGIRAGFSKGFVAILDSNVTTLLAAVVLFWLGTGTIKGFAVTLSIGILVSMFTAIFVTQMLLNAIVTTANCKEKFLFRM